MTEQNRRLNNINALKSEIKGIIKCLIDSVLNFYLIRLRATDLKRDLIENIITNMILTEETYVIMFRLYSELYEEDILCLRRLQDNTQLLEDKLSLASDTLKINKEFQMNLEVRSEYKYTGPKTRKSVKKVIPYNLPIRHLMKIDDIESPMCKIEHIFKCCT